ncbi:hypothetical protein [Selenomonas bovis]|uniref:hypothetical protein n=1 Tax=Selenomonas bovis TaxID=416586 RepID=UPI0003820D90|nr:hypothetical protein [Selenomonas bovis]
MRAILGVLAGMAAYVVAIILSFLFFIWFFDKPADWPYFIPIATALISISTAVGTADEVSGGKKAGAFLAILIAGMWIVFVVVDVVGDVSDILRAEHDEAGIFEIFMAGFDTFLSSKIFAVVSFFVAASSLEESRK